MRYDPPLCCPPRPHPPRIDIAPGMATLAARQIASFPEWRTALLASIDRAGPLAKWTADRPGDLGVMLIEFWSYVLDVTAFYDARLAERAYIATASEADIVGEVVALLGYTPRPALAASVEIALEALGADPVTAPARTGFRSEAFGSEPPQVFETLAAATVWPQRNSWTLAPYRLNLFDGTLRFRPGEGPSRGTIVAIEAGGTALFAGEVAAVDTEPDADGDRYLRVSFSPGTSLSPLSGRPLSSLRASALGLRAAMSTILTDGVFTVTGNAPGCPLSPTAVSGGNGTTGWVILDALYPQIAKGAIAALEISGALHAVMIGETYRFLHTVTFGSGTSAVTQLIPASLVTFAWTGTLSGRDIILHAAPRPLGAPTRPAELERSLADIITAPALKPIVAPLGDAPGDGSTIVVGQAAQGASIAGTIVPDGAGGGSFVPAGDTIPFAPPLSTPVRLFGNVVTATRGETVAREVIGSGDAARTFQTFKLQKKPLTWVTDAGVGLGRSPQIDLAVDGMYWTWVETLFGAGADDRVFTIAMDADGTAHLGFGDGVTGSRLPSGVSNIVAAYRYGAGAAKPPAGSIKQIARPVKGLARVIGPLAPFGGADAETPDAIRVTAPASMLALDRAVSAADYLAMARGFSGVINAAVAERWETARLRIVIDIAIIADGGDPTGALADYLTARSAPGVPVSVSAATKIAVPQFDVAVEVAPGYVADTVRAGVTGALFDPERGLLAPARVPVGAPVFHSVIVAAIFATPGVAGVPAITLAGGAMGQALVPPAGAYFDFLTNGKVV